MLRGALADDSGVTLIELLIAIMLLGVIAGTLTMAMMVGMQTVGDTKDRFESTNRQNFATRFVVPDIESNDNTSNASFGGYSPPDEPIDCAKPPQTPLFSAVQKDPTNASVAKTVQYAVGPGRNGCSLFRNVVDGAGATTSSTPVIEGLRMVGPATFKTFSAQDGFERPTLQLLLADDKSGDCPAAGGGPCPYDITVTASSRVGR